MGGAKDVDGSPALAGNLGEIGWGRKALASLATPPRGRLIFGQRQRSDRRIRTHRADEHDIGWELGEHRRVRVGRIRGDAQMPSRCPLRHDGEHFVRELGLGLEGWLTALAGGLRSIQAEEDRQRPRALREGHAHADGEDHPDVAETEDTKQTTGAYSVDVAAEPEDLGALVRDEGVVDHEGEDVVVAEVLGDLGEQQAADVVGRPDAARKKRCSRS